MKKILYFLFAAIMVTYGCHHTPKSAPVDIAAEKTAIKAVIDNMDKVFETNDADLLSTILSQKPDNVFFGTDAAERFVGYENFIEAQKEFFESVEKGSEITFREIVTGIGKSGDVAWISCFMDWKGMSQGEPFTFEGLRMTMVLEKQDGKWVIVHCHGSVPVSGQSIKY